MDETIILKPNKFKILLYLLVSLAFVAGGVWIIQEQRLIGWLNVLFFGICACVFIIILIPSSSYLKLTEQGFEIRTLFRTSFTKWENVDYFVVNTVGKTKFVAFDYINNKDSDVKVSRALTNFEASLPDTFGLKATELADLMNKWKDKASKTQANN